MAWGANFNFSVWHVEVKGIPDPELVQETYFQYINFRETESVRLCLKHFRQRKLIDAFKALQERTDIRLEDPLLTRLHQELVIKGNFKRAEELMTEAAGRGLFDSYIQSYDYKPIWKRLRSNSHRQGVHHHHHSHQAHAEESPRHRGGHQMCIDAQGGFVYLMGGWDGSRDLADFWAYHIPSQTWILISADTSLQGGPSARSCHKICYSPQHRAIFLLGKYVDPDNRSKVDLSSDFWRFDIDPSSPPRGRWTRITGNTAVVNGPELIYDHQMCLDPVSQTLYVFGGRVVHLDKNVQHYSGLYSYHIPSGVWRLLRADGQTPPKQDGSTVLRSRIGHSMLYDDMTRSLVIFAGQMNKDYLSDFYVYDIAADRVIEVCKDYNKQGGPEAGFTQRATISSRGREVYVLSGLVKDRTLGAETVKNSFWVFKLPGQDQMDAIRDVQWALANAKMTGTIGSLKSIMNHGRSLSEDAESEAGLRGNGSRSGISRRRVINEHGIGAQEAYSGTRRPSVRTGDDSLESIGSSSATENTSTRTILTRSASNGRKMSLRTGPASQSSGSCASSTHSARSENDLVDSPQTSNQGAPNTKEGAVSGISSMTSTLPRSALERDTDLNHPPSSAERDGSALSAEPMSLAYVLSDQGSWQKIFQNSSPELGEPSEPEPVPRYAHQLVYDEVNEVQYLFGGNPGEQGNMSKRLDDFWELRLYRPKPDEIVRRAKYLLRTQQFKELCQRPETSVLTSTTFASTLSNGSDNVTCIPHSSDVQKTNARHDSHINRNHANGTGHGTIPGLIQRGTPEHHDQSSRALRFLQTELSCVVDQSNKAESDDFKALIRGLLIGAFSVLARSSTPTHSSNSALEPSFSLSGTRINPAGSSAANAQKSTVLLAPSPVASPVLNGTSLSLNASTSAGLGSGTRPFLASPSCGSSDSPGFDADGLAVDSDRDGEDSPMQDYSGSRRTSRLLRPRRPTLRSVDANHLDNNGEKIGHADTRMAREERKGEGEIDADGDNKAMEKEVQMQGDEDLEMDEGRDDDYDEEDRNATMKVLYRDRTLLYEKLLEFFAEEVKQPRGDLTDLVKVG
ncbi:Muskelin 1, intracellular mediator containing kelch motif [Dissophora globulifera]|uniref:Muskelin 1, intracellular mediator containing kelch motif n=1 Tax=Dissophora globulifera TaxID=979702 RepID=A0A9P6UMD0_9FUNG|nr:Muskelin 1, intracellular mediator containing kelch motif [Dissophora globulifera]